MPKTRSYLPAADSASSRGPDLFLALEGRQLLAAPPDLTGVSGTFLDPEGDIVSFRLRGPGTVEVRFAGGGSSGGFTLVDTTLESALSISVRKGATGDGRLTLTYIDSLASVGKITAPKVDIYAGGVILHDANSVTLGGFTGGSDFTLEPGAGSVRLAFASVFGVPEDTAVFNVDVRQIESFSTNVMDRASISAGAIGKITVAKRRGDDQSGMMTRTTVTSSIVERLTAASVLQSCTLNVGAVGQITSPFVSGVDLNVDGVGTSGFSVKTLKLGRVEGFTVIALGAVDKVSAIDWGSGGIQATSLTRFTTTGLPRLGIRGDFTGGIQLSGNSVPGPAGGSGLAFGKVFVRGMFGGFLTTTESGGEIDVGGLENAQIGIGHGLTPMTNDLPPDLSGLSNPLATLRKLVVSTRASTTANFTNSVVVAPSIGVLTLANNTTDVANGGDVFGIATGGVLKLRLVNPRITLTNVSAFSLGSVPPDQAPFPLDFQATFTDASLFGSQPMLDGRLRFFVTVI